MQINNINLNKMIHFFTCMCHTLEVMTFPSWKMFISRTVEGQTQRWNQEL